MPIDLLKSRSIHWMWFSPHRKGVRYSVGIEKVHKVFDIGDALALLERYREKAELLAGGTDLLVHIREERNRGSIIVDISDIKEMKKIEITKNQIVLGALTTFSEITQNAYIKENIAGLWRAAKSVGSPQIRNMATIGGNICNASPAADIVPPLLALGASLRVRHSRGERYIKLNEFYLGRGKTTLKSDEMVISIGFPHSRNKKIYSGFEKLGSRNALAISKISCFICIDFEDNLMKDIKAASGALGEYPLREYIIEDFMKGKALSEKIINAAAIKYSEELKKRLCGRSSCEYKMEAAKGVFKKAIFMASRKVDNGGIS